MSKYEIDIIGERYSHQLYLFSCQNSNLARLLEKTCTESLNYAPKYQEINSQIGIFFEEDRKKSIKNTYDKNIINYAFLLYSYEIFDDFMDEMLKITGIRYDKKNKEKRTKIDFLQEILNYENDKLLEISNYIVGFRAIRNSITHQFGILSLGDINDLMMSDYFKKLSISEDIYLKEGEKIRFGTRDYKEDIADGLIWILESYIKTISNDLFLKNDNSILYKKIFKDLDTLDINFLKLVSNGKNIDSNQIKSFFKDENIKVTILRLSRYSKWFLISTTNADYGLGTLNSTIINSLTTRGMAFLEYNQVNIKEPSRAL
ncbi:MAG: hypothetical protein PHQ95_02815 [Candidatus Gracilibacteria bacterium]|nr:hypothetical protein [Candidatus Gracilibacteria bacterium]